MGAGERDLDGQVARIRVADADGVAGGSGEGQDLMLVDALVAGNGIDRREIRAGHVDVDGLDRGLRAAEAARVAADDLQNCLPAEICVRHEYQTV